MKVRASKSSSSLQDESKRQSWSSYNSALVSITISRSLGSLLEYRASPLRGFTSKEKMQLLNSKKHVFSETSFRRTFTLIYNSPPPFTVNVDSYRGSHDHATFAVNADLKFSIIVHTQTYCIQLSGSQSSIKLFI